MKILMTGATGLIGKQLGLELSHRGHELTIVSRNGTQARGALPFPCKILEFDLNVQQIPSEILQGIEACVNLLGENVAAQRWSEKQKRKILNSRVLTTRHLAESFGHPFKVFISVSAIGIYSDRGEEELTEKSQAGDDFLAHVCQDWEQEADRLNTLARVVKPRLGLVLSQQGGALEKMLPPFRLGLGGRISTGRQWMSWVHIQDVVSFLVEAIENSKFEGVYNLTSPKPVRNEEFSRTLAKVLNRRLGPPVPLVALRILFGEIANTMVASEKVLPERALNAGFHFKFTDLEKTFRDLLLLK
jgi:uncharacterized protein (TIGR01777 family)